MRLSQQIIDHIARNRTANSDDIIVRIVDMCINDRDGQCDPEPVDTIKWVPFDMDLARPDARVRFRDGGTGSIHEVRLISTGSINQSEFASAYPITAARDRSSTQMTFTAQGEHCRCTKSDFDIVDIETEGTNE